MDDELLCLERCCGCQGMFSICRRCYRGQTYCGDACRVPARAAQARAARSTYQRSYRYRPSYPDRPFTLIEDARRWVEGFVRWYNDDHQHSGIRFVTPSQRHGGHDAAILAHRTEHGLNS